MKRKQKNRHDFQHLKVGQDHQGVEGAGQEFQVQFVFEITTCSTVLKTWAIF